jgi:uncharacterized protein (DUF58 family)
MARPVPDSLFLVVDARLHGGDEMAFAHRETRLQFAATLIEHALHHGYLVGLAIAGVRVPFIFTPATGLGSRCDMLDALAEVNGSDQVDLNAVVAEIPPRAPRNSQTLLVAERPADISLDAMDNLVRASRNVIVLGPTELAQVFEPNPLTSQGGGA